MFGLERDGEDELLTVCLSQVKHQSVSMVVAEEYMQSWTSEAGCVLVVCDEEEEQMSGGGGWLEGHGLIAQELSYRWRAERAR